MPNGRAPSCKGAPVPCVWHLPSLCSNPLDLKTLLGVVKFRSSPDLPECEACGSPPDVGSGVWSCLYPGRAGEDEG